VLLGGLIASVAGLDVAMLVIAAQLPATTVPADYYQRALEWDRRDPEETRLLELGWTAVLETPKTGEPPYVLVVANAHGQAVTGLTVEVEYFHRGRPREVKRAQLIERAPGRYGGLIEVVRAGAHELRFVLDGAEARCAARRLEFFTERRQ
jgi:hypothetical protein